MKQLQKLLKYILIIVLLLWIGTGEYLIYGKREEWAKPHSGTVIHSFIAYGRSTVCLATVRFDNGDIQEVNTGSYLYNKGDRFTGRLSWNPIMGISGWAYSWHPGDWVLWFVLPTVLFHIFLFSFSVGYLFYFAFVKKIKT